MRILINLLIVLFCLWFFSGIVYAADLYMPSGCGSISACNSAASSGDTVHIADGTYSDSFSGLKSGVTFQAVNDGEVNFTGSFNPGNNGFTMKGIIIKSSNQKELGGNNTYDRMSFVGGPGSGNTVNSLIENGTTITNSAFYGEGGRYLLLAYQQTGSTITLTNIIFRPDGGWSTSYEPQAALNYYNSNGLDADGLILIDAITDSSDEIIGGLGFNAHNSVGNAGSINNSAIVGCDEGYYGRFYADGNGSLNSSHDQIAVMDNSGSSWSVTRNVNGTTSIGKLLSDGSVGRWTGSVTGPTGTADFELNSSFLNDTRWTDEMCDDEGVSRGVCGTSKGIGTYVSDATGLDLDEGAPSYTECDINEDGVENSTDVSYLIDVILETESSSKGDLNEDTNVNILDVMVLIGVVNGAACPI